MIKKLLGSIAILLLFSGCGDGTDGLRDGMIRPEVLSQIEISNICDNESSEYKTESFEMTCGAFKKLDYIKNPPEICEEITFLGYDGKTHTGLFVYAQQSPECK